MYWDMILIVCSMSHDHFNYLDFIYVFEDFNGLNITVIVNNGSCDKSDSCYLGIPLLRYTVTE